MDKNKQIVQPSQNISKGLFKSMWAKKPKENQYGNDKRKEFEEKLLKAEKLIIECRVNGWFEKKDWQANGLDWTNVLKDLFMTAEDYATINIKMMQIEQGLKKN